jgi:hypothetical protein
LLRALAAWCKRESLKSKNSGAHQPGETRSSGVREKAGSEIVNEKQKISYDAFMAGVDWALKAVMHCGIYNLTEKEAGLFRARARKIVTASADRLATQDSQLGTNV